MDKVTPTSLQGSAILVVEDEFFQADDLSRALSEAGASLVGPFGTVASALAALAQGARIDAAVLDINLRGVSVAPLAEALAARGIPFMFATGYERSMLPSSWRKVPVCQKPFHTEQLVEVVGSLCSGPTGDWNEGKLTAADSTPPAGTEKDARPSATPSRGGA